MTLPARFAILNRLTDVRRETALQVWKLGAPHRPAISLAPFATSSGLVPRDQRDVHFRDIELQQPGQGRFDPESYPDIRPSNFGFLQLLNNNAH